MKSYRVVMTREGKYKICRDLYSDKFEGIFIWMGRGTFPRHGTVRYIKKEVIDKAVPSSEANLFTDEIIKVGV